MTSQNSKDLLDWYRTYWNAKAIELGVENTAPSNGNIPFTSDVRVQAAYDWILGEEAALDAAFVPEMEPFWQVATLELAADLDARPANIQALFDTWSSDPDTLTHRLLKSFHRYIGKQIQQARYRESLG